MNTKLNEWLADRERGEQDIMDDDKGSYIIVEMPIDDAGAGAYYLKKEYIPKEIL